jgi:tetratricopeptide (TPR) repeat protein
MPILLDENVLNSFNTVQSLAQVFTLDDAQQDTFLQQFNSPKNKDIAPNLRIYNYLQNKLTNFNNYADTLVARDSLSQGSGNCLSLAILTKSLATLANIPIQYEIVETAPIYQRADDILIVLQHIRTTLFYKNSTLRGKQKTSLKDISIDYYPTDDEVTLKIISESEFYSMFYTNTAAEFLVSKDNDLVYWYLKKALELYPQNVQAINMMGIIHKRLGYLDIAENLYLYGLSLDKNNMTIMNNYYALLKQQNRLQEAQKIELQLKHHATRNPFYWIERADNAYAVKEYQLAFKYYKKASSIANYLHQPYAGIAKSKQKLGKAKAAHIAINKAIKNLHTNTNKDKYQEVYEQFLLNLQ